MTSHYFSRRSSEIAIRHLAMAVIFSAGWATSVAFAGVSGPTAAGNPIAVRPADVEQSGFPDENGLTYDLNQLVGNAPYSMTRLKSITDKGQIATYRYGPKGQVETVLLTPTAIPLPSTPWAALTVVPLMLLARRHRHFRR
jgi:hypothetical protein